MGGIKDVERHVVAAHELGHALAFREAGQTISEIRVMGHGASVEGYTDLSNSVINGIEQGVAFLVAILAGRAAGERWCEINDYTRPGPAACRTDRRLYAKVRREHPELAPFTTAKVMPRARKLVRARWRQIERLGPRLAARGTVTL